MPRPVLLPSLFLLLLGLLLPGSAAALGSRFIISTPPLDPPVAPTGEARYRVSGGLQQYSSSDADLTGLTLGVARRQALEDPFAFTLGGQFDYVSGTARIQTADDDLTLWRTTLYAIGEYRHRFTPVLGAVLFAGPKVGYGEYEMDYRPVATLPEEHVDGREETYGYLVGVRAPVKAGGDLRLTPFLSYEALDARARERRTAGGNPTLDRTYEITQYGVELRFVSTGLTLGAIVQHWTDGTADTTYTLYQVGYQF
ncbi:hypothetical protein AN478_04745 [Thiohalorhabdus denitrificans]|uniref:Uncharacterized protein n=1 Tax=Thiohalorhabdus denitrificans TaxID=381306 RepID=A0A0P9GLT6_9GAMM|nr:hypothetical protein [Thiohalorhabdus denitrificans]KPV41201.1 hypothetical protein AN478_04745 [Thiohalorhabdus denitrificans]SCY63343.1 hypothetical protein SAMN05661077_2758 [Thiohalorhabdus denitrificans]